jgi:hypothetical protein
VREIAKLKSRMTGIKDQVIFSLQGCNTLPRSPTFSPLSSDSLHR